ncbi:flap endonuclease GEN-like [Culicoides brevitarsis]|uniref:flap endonuclease GEN-like n=1 Tax=Culicoides brevitarsis TaxID=469753 RepID=UPI00307C2C99
MGIKDLWNILTPYCERKPLHVLEGQKVGIDLSGWICESQCVVDYFVQPKMYLRNLFFRTAYLLLMDIQPVFILDGEAPKLKHLTIQKRNEIQFIGARPRPEGDSDSVKSKKKELKGRTRFKYVLKQCSDLLATLGISTIQAIGEAEALCAWLNKLGYLDGIISQDSDCFGYGATCVYRNFSVSKQGKTAAQGGSVDIYDMTRIWQALDIKQNKAVVLALLCGCDYCPGVDGIGKDSVLKLFAMYKDDEILQKMREWRDKNENLTATELKVDDKSYCNNCGHYGTAQKHSKSGCSSCRTSLGCDGSVWKEQRLIIKAELQIRKKALVQEDFPQEDIIEEFLQEPQLPDSRELDMDWKQPNIVKFVKTLSKLLQWPEIYCFQKILPILTRWQLTALSKDPHTKFTRGSVYPSKIVKKRVLKGVESYEILWEDTDKCFDAIFSVEEIKAFEIEHPKEGLDLLWSTVEPKILVEKAYPAIVERYLELTQKPKKTTTRRKKQVDGENTPRIRKKAKKAQNSSLNDMSGLIEAINDVEKSKKPTKKAPKKQLEKGIQPISKFLQLGALAQSTPTQKISPKTRTPLQIINRKREISFAINVPSDFSDDEDMSGSYIDVINGILEQKPDKSQLDGLKLFYDEPRVTQFLSKDDSVLLKSKKKSFRIDLSVCNNSIDDFLLKASQQNYIYEPEEAPATRDELNASYFFQGITENPGTEDLFEESVQILTTI